MRESVIEGYLAARVQQAGGASYKFVSPGRRNVPDRIVLWPRPRFSGRVTTDVTAEVHFVETKAPGKKPSAGQQREHTRLWALGCTVVVLDTKEKVDSYVKGNKC